MKKKSKMEPKLTIDKYGNKHWRLKKKLHRIDGPAIEYANGSKFWFLNGKQVKKEDVIKENLTEREYIEFVIKNS